MKKTYIFDNCTLIDYFKYYSNDNKNIYDFLINKIQKEEILIIDKIIDFELKGNEEFKKEIRKHSVKTEFLAQTIEEYYFTTKRHHNKNYKGEYLQDKKKALDTDADLYLIELAKYLSKTQLSKVCIVTNETLNEKYNSKLLKKIPTICKDENIECMNMAKYLFKEHNFKITNSTPPTN